MLDNTTDLNALIGSRICHDLISPVGAISNGVELMEMTIGDDSPEMALIKQSVVNASARIRFFRIAFGLAGSEQEIGKSEVEGILKDYFEPTRLRVQWLPTQACRRKEVKLLFLGLLCAETAMPYGGTIRVMQTGDQWTVQGEADKLRIDPDLWSTLATGATKDLGAAQVHFPIAQQLAASIGRQINFSHTDTRVMLTF